MPIMGGTETVRKLREGRYVGWLVGVTGDPPGCPDRLEFESAGLDFCADKDTPGLLAICEQLRSLDVRRQLEWHARSEVGGGGDERDKAGKSVDPEGSEPSPATVGAPPRADGGVGGGAGA